MIQIFGVLDLELILVYWKNLFPKAHENKSLEIPKNLHLWWAVANNKEFSVLRAVQSLDPSGYWHTGCLASELPPSRVSISCDHLSSTVLAGRAHSFQTYCILGGTNADPFLNLDKFLCNSKKG